MVKVGDVGSCMLDNFDLQKILFIVLEVGCVDLDVVKSMFFFNNCDVLLQKGGFSDKVQCFCDDKFNDLLIGIFVVVELQQCLQLIGDVQCYLIDNVYVIFIFEELQVFVGVLWVKGVSFEVVGCLLFYGVWLDKY